MDNFLDFVKANLQYNYDHNQKDYILFLRIPKNASSSIMDHLGDRNLIKKYERRLEASLDNNIYKEFFSVTHARPHEIQSLVDPIEIKSSFSFSVVRNPWDRVVSMYFFGKKMGLGDLFDLDNDVSFEYFCEILNDRKLDRSFMPTFQQVEWTHGGIEVAEILKFENLSEDFSNMIKTHKIKGISTHLPHINRTDHKNYRDYFSERTKKIVQYVFEEDCEAFKYSF